MKPPDNQLALARQRHHESIWKQGRCGGCFDWWPCDASLLAAELERVEAERAAVEAKP